MIEYLSDALSFVAGAGISVLAYRLSRKKPVQVVEPGTIKWAWMNRRDGTTPGFRCPPCCNESKNTKQMPHCDCVEFPRDHFHFTCGDCGFKAIMRTADDPIDKPKTKWMIGLSR